MNDTGNPSRFRPARTPPAPIRAAVGRGQVGGGWEPVQASRRRTPKWRILVHRQLGAIMVAHRPVTGTDAPLRQGQGAPKESTSGWREQVDRARARAAAWWLASRAGRGDAGGWPGGSNVVVGAGPGAARRGS